MLQNTDTGLLRVPLICRRDEIIPEKSFWRRALCDTPAVGSAVLILHIDEIRNADVALYLQPRHAGLKAGIAALAIVQDLFRPFGQDHFLVCYGLI